MNEEQSGNRNSAGLDPVTERTTKNQRGKTHRVIKDKGMIPLQTKERS
jgi:hypothetical protein